MEGNNNLDGFLEAFLNDPQTRKWFETQQAFQNEESNQNFTKEHEMGELEKLSNQNRFDRGDAMQRVNQAMDNDVVSEAQINKMIKLALNEIIRKK